MTFTHHGMIRTEERAGYAGDKANRFVKNALTNGKISEECCGRLKKYLEQKSNQDRKAVAYEGYCFIVSAEHALITIFRIPEDVFSKEHFDGKEHICKYKKYMKLNKDRLYENYGNMDCEFI